MKLAEAYHCGWQNAVHPDDLPGLLERWRLILASGEPGEIEARFRRFDNEYRSFLIRTVPVHNKQGKIVRWYGISVDYNDQALERQRSQISLTRALDELKKSKDKLRTIIDTMPTIAWCALPDGSGLCGSSPVSSLALLNLARIVRHSLGLRCVSGSVRP